MATVLPIVTNHIDIIHDSQFDYYGQLLATCSSDRTIKIFSVTRTNTAPQLEAHLEGHDGPVWMIAWAHPRFGQLLASCSYDNRAIIWANRTHHQQASNHQWRPIHIINSGASVNGIAWAPQEYGLILATASSDGSVSVSACVDGMWREPSKVGTGPAAHPIGAMAVSFLPFTGKHVHGFPMLASAGCDGCVRTWMTLDGAWTQIEAFDDHSDWVRDVAFSPGSHSATHVMLASCAQDKKVIVRRKPLSDVGNAGGWERSVTTLPSGVWRLSWNVCGTSILATTGDSEAILLTQGKSFADPWLMSSVDEKP